MKIQEVVTEICRLKRNVPIRNGRYEYAAEGHIIVRVHTDDGIEGIGFTHAQPGPDLAVFEATKALSELAIGLERLRTGVAPADPRYRNGYWGEQFTGGSSSMRGEWTVLREAAARTRLRLVRAAARRWGVAPAQCRSDNGGVGPPGSGRPPRHETLRRRRRSAWNRPPSRCWPACSSGWPPPPAPGMPWWRSGHTVQSRR